MGDMKLNFDEVQAGSVVLRRSTLDFCKTFKFVILYNIKSNSFLNGCSLIAIDLVIQIFLND